MDRRRDRPRDTQVLDTHSPPHQLRCPESSPQRDLDPSLPAVWAAQGVGWGGGTGGTLGGDGRGRQVSSAPPPPPSLALLPCSTDRADLLFDALCRGACSHAVLLVNKDKRGRFVGGADGAGSGAAELVGRGGLFFHELDREHGRLTSYQVTDSPPSAHRLNDQQAVEHWTGALRFHR